MFDSQSYFSDGHELVPVLSRKTIEGTLDDVRLSIYSKNLPHQMGMGQN